jgi:hypothetical protein
MAITVYWACYESEWMRAKEPESIYQSFSRNKKNLDSGISFCPSVKDYMNNTFSIKSIYDYDFEVLPATDGAWTNTYTQEFYDKHVVVRSRENKLFSFLQKIIFFTEEDSLIMSAGILPYLEDNNITKNCITIPGKFDIGKWFRMMDFAFYLKDDKFVIKEDEIYQYIHFETNEKIIFKQFKMNQNLHSYSEDVLRSKDFKKKKVKALKDHYSLMRHKKGIIKEIKNNLI